MSNRVGYLGPGGSWTHQACLDLFGGDELVPLEVSRLFEDYTSGCIDHACVPVTTSVVGVTPYLDFVLNLPDVVVVAEYPKMLGYSLLASPGTKLEDIRRVTAHPVALEEVKPWLDLKMPTVQRIPAVTGGDAARSVAESGDKALASMGPRIGGEIYGLISLADGIEEGPHNVTRWWVLGREMPVATGDDKTALLAEVSDNQLSSLLSTMSAAELQIMSIYERPSKKTLDTHRYLLEIKGHAQDRNVATFLAANDAIRALGSYARKY
ncbi:prephenate dehydratase [Paraburkholderia unamae]|nr:prephenate dehydratase domain-containing protein [Paraburkholderia unamae]RAR57134.1 prephenate dehydratase [Paraburkholderia unamae]